MLVRRIRKRGANIVVEAHGEILFAATGDVGRWTNRFSNRLTALAAKEAPVNKRPRWMHYGKPLKSTMTSSTSYQPGRMKVFAAVGSTAPYALYVEEGTGIYAGNGPYQAKILPPWTPGSPSLYEHTWRPGPGEPPVGTTTVKGQKGQHFMGIATEKAFRSMKMRSHQVPGDPTTTLPDVTRSDWPDLFSGTTPVDAAFVMQLERWRAWRDDAWKARESLGKEHRPGIKRSQDLADQYGRAQAGVKEAAMRQALAKGDADRAEARRRRIAADETLAAAGRKQRLLNKVKAERATWRARAEAEYAGMEVRLGGRRKRLGGYAYHLQVIRKGRVVVDKWIQSSYQAPI